MHVYKYAEITIGNSTSARTYTGRSHFKNAYSDTRQAMFDTNVSALEDVCYIFMISFAKTAGTSNIYATLEHNHVSPSPLNR